MARDLNPRPNGNFGGRWRLSVAWVVNTPDLLGTYTILCHTKLQTHVWPSPFRVVRFTAFMLHPRHKKEQWIDLSSDMNKDADFCNTNPKETIEPR